MMTDGQKMVWSARFERVQHEHMMGLMAEWHAQRASNDPQAIPRDQQVAMFQESVRNAVEQANGAVLAMRLLPPPEGQAGAYLRELLGIPEPLRLALPEGYPEPMDYTLAPPGWMFPEGCTDVVHLMPVTSFSMEGPKFQTVSGLQVVTYHGERHFQLFQLAQAWREHMEREDPPGFQVIDYSKQHLSPPVEVRLRCMPDTKGDRGKGILLGLMPSLAEGRAFAWRCSERPQHVIFAIRLGTYLGKGPPEIIGWADAELAQAMAYIQAMSAWEAARPDMPAFLADADNAQAVHG